MRPGSTAEVAAVVRACAEARRPDRRRKAATPASAAAPRPTPGSDAVVISLLRMNRIRAVDADNATITVEAGVPLVAVQQAAADAGLMFPLSLASEGSCTIGGNLSTNAGGTAVLRFGNARELTLGIEVVLADGRVWDGLRGLRKDNTGYDLKQLFIGAEGTLGIVTAAVLKLFPAPRTRVTALAALGDVPAAVALLHALQAALGDRLVGFELMSAFSLALSRKHHPALPDPLPGHPWYVLVQADDSAADANLAAELEAALAAAARGRRWSATSWSRSQASRPRALWALRENITEAQRREGPEHQARHLAAGVGDSAIPRRVAARRSRRRCRALRFVTFGHLGDGNLHYNLVGAARCRAEAFHGKHAGRATGSSTTWSPRIGGSISAEHGIGQLKRDELVRYKSAGGARPDARAQGGVRPARASQSRQGALATVSHGQSHLLDRRRVRRAVRAASRQRGARRSAGPTSSKAAVAGEADGPLRDAAACSCREAMRARSPADIVCGDPGCATRR